MAGALAEAVELVVEVLGSASSSRRSWVAEPVQLVARRGDADVLAQREERSREHDDDSRAEQEQRSARRRAGARTADRAPGAAAWRHPHWASPSPALPGARGRTDGGALARALVDGRSVADREPQARRARVEEREAVDMPVAPESSRLDLEAIAFGRAVLALVDLVLRRP